MKLNRGYTFETAMRDIIEAIFKNTPAETIAFKAITIGNDGSNSLSRAYGRGFSLIISLPEISLRAWLSSAFTVK